MKRAPRFVLEGAAAATAVGRKLQRLQARKKARLASLWLIAFGSMMIVFTFAVTSRHLSEIRAAGIAAAGILRHPDGTMLSGGMLHEAMVRGVLLTMAANVALAAVFIGFGLWARKSPIIPPVAALTIWMTLQVIEATLSPESIARGWLIKMVLITALVASVKSGFKARHLHAKPAPIT